MRQQPDDDSWFKKQITLGNVLSIASIVGGLAAFYFNTSNAIEAQAKAITKIETKLDQSEKKDDKQQREVLNERGTLRAEMTTRNEKINDSISDLSKQTAVLSTIVTGVRDDVLKLSAQITNLQNQRK